jgi:tetratricopeptide (TPR) repeat protein
MHTWALQKMSSILVDSGRPLRAIRYARAYLAAAKAYPALAGFTGFVYRDLGIAAMRLGNYREAVRWYAKSRRQFASVGDYEQSARSAFNVVWAYCTSGQAHLAALSMPSQVPDSLHHLYLSASAAVAAAHGDRCKALHFAVEALACDRPNYDQVDAADLCAIAARSGSGKGISSSLPFAEMASGYAARQGYSVSRVLFVGSNWEGGEFSEATADHHGSADLHDSSCYTTGVA